MNLEKSITKVTHSILRADGSEVRIVAEALFGLDLTRSIDVYVLRRESADHEWRLCSDVPHPEWRNMPLDEYILHGRSEKRQAVSHGEIFKVSSLIGTSMAFLTSA